MENPLDLGKLTKEYISELKNYNKTVSKNIEDELEKYLLNQFRKKIPTMEVICDWIKNSNSNSYSNSYTLICIYAENIYIGRSTNIVKQYNVKSNYNFDNLVRCRRYHDESYDIKYYIGTIEEKIVKYDFYTKKATVNLHKLMKTIFNEINETMTSQSAVELIYEETEEHSIILQIKEEEDK